MNAADSPTPAITMLRLLGGYQISQALFVAARAGLADQLLDGPIPLAELATATGLRPGPLARIVHALAGEGVFALDAGTGLVRLGPLGRTLASGLPESVRNIALMWMDSHYRAFGELWGTAETGRPAAEIAFGEPLFDWIGQDPARVRAFSAAMTDFARAIRHHSLDAVELDGARTVVDVGGADGTVLAVLAERYPHLRGTVFDLPHVVTAAPEVLRAHGVDDRITTAGGDFFVEVPPADSYLACFILHDWSDEKAGLILGNIHRAADATDARLILVETVLDEGAAPEVASLLDLTMLGVLTGRERTRPEWRDLLAASGFRLDRIRTTPGPMCVIEATRVP
ncbi:methyltransferase [Kitasatospora sp. NPDC093558]|uniref:methyltransferase n=1 Tax=Kitasatospora sp. NPDC093558 TaxID=3155201 RepID=UPI0034217ADF